MEGWGGASRSSSGWVDLGDSAFGHGEGSAGGGGGGGGGAAQGSRGARGRFLGAPGRRYAGVRGGGWSVGSLGSVGGQPGAHVSSLPYGFPSGGTQSSGNGPAAAAGPAPRRRHGARQPGENGSGAGGSGDRNCGINAGENGSGAGGGGVNGGVGGGTNGGVLPAAAADGLEDRGVAWRRPRRTLLPGSRWEAVQGALRDGRLLALPWDRRYSSVSATFSRLFPDTFDRWVRGCEGGGVAKGRGLGRRGTGRSATFSRLLSETFNRWM